MTTAMTPLRLITSTLDAWVPAQRRLVLVDIENFIGGSAASAPEVVDALAVIRHGIGTNPNDVWVTACGPRLLACAIGAFPTRVLLGRGIDGADRQLTELLSPDAVVGRYATVALVSGDARAFTAPVRTLASHGVPTDVYLGAGLIGADLYRAARSATSLDRGLAAAAA